MVCRGEFIFIKILPHCLDISLRKSEHDRRHTTFIMNYVATSRVCAGLKCEIELLRIVFAVVSLRARVPAAAIIVEMDSAKSFNSTMAALFAAKNSHPP